MFLFLILGGATALVIKLRYDAARERTMVVARLSEETAALEQLTPTERLFQAEGVPLVSSAPTTAAAPSATGTATQPPPPPTPLSPDHSSPPSGATTPEAAGSPSDLAELFEGVELPCDLAPVSMTGEPGINCSLAVFATSKDHRPVLSAALGDEFTRIGCRVTWVDNSTAQVRRGSHNAVVTIYDHPADHTNADGSPAFPTVGPSQLVVKLTAV